MDLTVGSTVPFPRRALVLDGPIRLELKRSRNLARGGYAYDGERREALTVYLPSKQLFLAGKLGRATLGHSFAKTPALVDVLYR